MPKKFTTMKEILEKNQRERDQRMRRVMSIQNINISPELIKKFAKAFEEEQTRKGKGEIGKIKKFIGSLFFLLALFTAILGCIWFIKIALRGIF